MAKKMLIILYFHPVVVFLKKEQTFQQNMWKCTDTRKFHFYFHCIQSEEDTSVLFTSVNRAKAHQKNMKQINIRRRKEIAEKFDCKKENG